MKKVLLLPFIAVFLTIAPVVLAHSSGNISQATTFQEKLQLLREKREEISENRQEKREEFKERVATSQAQARLRVVENIQRIFSKILKRFEAALARLDKIADRIATRIDKLKDKGVNTSAAQTQLAEAEVLGALAQTAIGDAQAAIDGINVQSVTVRDAVHAARSAVVSAKEALKNYHKALVEAIRELKAAASLREGTGSAE